MAKLNIRDGFSLDRLDLASKGLVNTRFLGNYPSIFKGEGLEFDSYRAYTPNDDASRIDWKASKRVGQTLIKEFVEERNLTVYFLVDVSSTMLTGSTHKLKAEYAAEMIASVSKSIVSSGDSVGFILFSDSVIAESSPQQGLSQYHSLLKNLSTVSHYGGDALIDSALEYAFSRIPDESLVFLISDFVGGIGEKQYLRLCAKKFDLICVMIRDPRDLDLPSGIGEVLVEDPRSGETLLVRPNRVRGKYRASVASEIKMFRRILERYGSDFLFLNTAKPFLREVIPFFNRRSAQWR